MQLSITAQKHVNLLQCGQINLDNDLSVAGVRIVVHLFGDAAGELTADRGRLDCAECTIGSDDLNHIATPDSRCLNGV